MEKKSIFERLGIVEKIEIPAEETIAAENELMNNTKEEKQPINNNETVRGTEEMEIKNTIDTIEDPRAIIKSKKLMKIDEIYKQYNIDTQGINSFYIVESFQKALPDYLPSDVKRQSILNILTSSNVKVESLLEDGKDKLNCLNEFSSNFNNDADELFNKFEEEIKKLNEKISNYKEAIENMKKLQNEQQYSIKYEIEKINNILGFIEVEK